MPKPGYHGIMPDISHDENALMDFVGSFKSYVTSDIQSGNKEVYEKLIVPKFNKTHSRNPKDRHEVHKEMIQITTEVAGDHWKISSIERFKFYEEAKKAYAIIATNETRPFGMAVKFCIKY